MVYETLDEQLLNGHCIHWTRIQESLRLLCQQLFKDIRSVCSQDEAGELQQRMEQHVQNLGCDCKQMKGDLPKRKKKKVHLMLHLDKTSA